MVSSPSYRIGMLTPYAWTVPGGVNQHINALAERFTAQGHRVTIVAPSDDKAAVKDARSRVRGVLLGKRDEVFDPDDPYPRHFFAGGTFKIRYNQAVSVIAVPTSLISNLDVLLETAELDILHVHEPFVPSLGWSALRHAECPLVTTFHANAERFLTYWVSRPLMQRYMDAFDGVIAVSPAARETIAHYVEGEFRIIPNGIDLGRFAPLPERQEGPLRVLFVGTDSRRKGLRVFLRSLKYLGDAVPGIEVHVCGSDKHEAKFAHVVPERFAGQVFFHGRLPNDEVTAHFQRADVFCAPSLGSESFGIVLLEAMATGTAIVASNIGGYRDVVTHGQEGLLVPPDEPRELAAALRRVLTDSQLRARFGAAGIETAASYSWDTVAGKVLRLYEEVSERVKTPSRARARARARARETLFADLHIHSHHSADSTMTVPAILARAREVGLQVIAVTDHNSVAGGLEAQAMASGYGMRVIVGSEIKTAEGEVIGLFLERDVPAGLPFVETVAAIKAQGGVVYLPHPFDRLHSTPSLATLKEVVGDIDVVEVFNSRIAFPGFNERAEKFAQRYRLAAAAGSDAHVLPGIGTAMVGMGNFTGADDFAAALVGGRIVRRRKSLIYLQSLKAIQSGLDGPAKEGRR